MNERRVGTPERSQALERLGSYFADGYIDVDEFDRRSSQAAAATWSNELDALFQDLPTKPSAANVPDTGDAADKELDSLMQRGKKLETVDTVTGVATTAIALLCLFVFEWGYFWLVFIAGSLVPLAARSVLRVDDDEEKLYEKISGVEKQERNKRLEHAAERRRELGA